MTLHALHVELPFLALFCSESTLKSARLRAETPRRLRRSAHLDAGLGEAAVDVVHGDLDEIGGGALEDAVKGGALGIVPVLGVGVFDAGSGPAAVEDGGDEAVAFGLLIDGDTEGVSLYADVRPFPLLMGSADVVKDVRDLALMADYIA